MADSDNPDTLTPTRVTMYTNSWCPSVRMARRYLDRLGVEYTEIDIDRTPGAARQVEEWSGGYRTVPTFEIDGTIVVDFNLRQLNSALGL